MASFPQNLKYILFMETKLLKLSSSVKNYDIISLSQYSKSILRSNEGTLTKALKTALLDWRMKVYKVGLTLDTSIV